MNFLSNLSPSLRKASFIKEACLIMKNDSLRHIFLAIKSSAVFCRSVTCVPSFKIDRNLFINVRALNSSQATIFAFLRILIEVPYFK